MNEYMLKMPWMDSPALALEPLFTAHGCKQTYKENVIFKHAYEPNSKLFYILEGFCYSFTASEDGEVNITRLHTRGSILGEATCATEAMAIAHTKSVTPCTVYSMEYELFARLVTGDIDLVKATIAMYSWRVASYNISHYVKNTFPAQQKLAFLLMSRHEDGENGRRIFPFRFTHRQLGELVGLSRETVSRILSKMQSDGVIEYTDDGRICYTYHRLQKWSQ